MKQIFLIGLGAGAATALLVASVKSGALVSLVLFQLAALPILIAALGWSHWAGLVAAAFAAAILATILSPSVFFSFLVGIGLPAWWLGYLALLARPASGTPDRMEWYPVGRLVIWAAILGAGAVIAAIANFGLDDESFRSGLSNQFERALRRQAGLSPDEPLKIPGVENPAVFIALLVAIVPIFGAMFATLTSFINLYLAARIVNISGLLKRPWPSLPNMQFPSFVPALFAAAIAGTFLSGLVGTIAIIIAVSLSMAYGALGFAVLHVITGGMNARPFLLTTAYVASFIIGWPILLAILLGLADAIFNFRGRVAGSPPVSPT